MLSCRSRFDPSGAFASFACNARRRSSPIRSSMSSSTASHVGASVTSTPGHEQVARVEAHAEPLVPAQRARRSLRARRPSGRSSHRRRRSSPSAATSARCSGRAPARAPGTTRSRPVSKPAPRCEPTWKTTPSASIAHAASTVARIVVDALLVDRVVGRGEVDEVERVHEHAGEAGLLAPFAGTPRGRLGRGSGNRQVARALDEELHRLGAHRRSRCRAPS